jgi:DNA repair protein RecN (Recombination protein N)
MLQALRIKNYAIIDELEIQFGKRMNIITGETGAGKSILVGALGLILGERADTKILYNNADKCVVEAEFEVSEKGLKKFFESHELDFDKHAILRREINQSGKSRAFINDTPVTLQLLKLLGEKIVNLHSQHETLDLVKSGFQLNVIDAIAKNGDLLNSYRENFTLYKSEKRRLDDLKEKLNSSSAELDYLNFQLNELTEANLEDGEQEQLETEQSTLSNVEVIKRSVQAAINTLSSNDGSVLEQLNEAQQQLKSVKQLNKDIQALTDRLHSSYEEIKDIAAELESVQDDTLLDPERLLEVEERLNTIYKLQKKHNLINIEGLIQLRNELENKIAAVEVNSSEVTNLEISVSKQLKEVIFLGNQLHTSRDRVLREFQNSVVVLLTKVGMPNASFKVEIQKLNAEQLNENGLTEISFLFSANKGFAPIEIKDVASGGELSRLMLCIKSLMADAGDLPTMIFDEIDAGISGEVALKVGEIMKKLTRNHQLITITHLPQIARTADKHLYIFKEDTDNRTKTKIRELNTDERVLEIAKMLSGNKPSEVSLANARELISS